MNKSTLQCISKLSVAILFIIGLAELGLALWSVFDDRYRILAYNLADVGYIDLWILRYLSLCLFASSIITLVMCLILVWGLCSTHIFLFIASTMIVLVFIGEFTIAILTLSSKYQTRLTLMEQLPKLVITYRQGTDERAKRALDYLQLTFRCCGSDGRLSYQNNVPLSCTMFSIGCLTRTIYFLDATMDSLAFVLLFFSLIKLLIVLFFYSFLCLHRRHSSSVDSSPTENLPRKTFLLPLATDQEEQQDYGSSSPNTLRKLSAISERTDESDVDAPRPRYITTIVKRKYPPVKSRRRILQNEYEDDEDNDSGINLSEQSFGGQKHKSSSSLGFSKVFVTSVSHVQPIDDSLNSSSLTTSTSDSSLLTRPRSILKKTHPQKVPLLLRVPKPRPRTSRKQDESLL